MHSHREESMNSRSRFVPLLAVAAVAALVLPWPVHADRGAVTLDAGGFVAVNSVPPAVGLGSAVAGSSGGGVLGVRYGLANEVEVSAGGFYEAPATYFHPGTTIVNGDGTFAGTLQSRTSSWGATVGARWVKGTVWRYFVGGELGFSRRVITRLDLIDVSDATNPHSFGLALADVSTTALLVAPLAGVEWAVSDHVSLGIAPRLQLYVGSQSGLRFLVPVMFSYSWY